jgi:hypothetical protein
MSYYYKNILFIKKDKFYYYFCLLQKYITFITRNIIQTVIDRINIVKCVVSGIILHMIIIGNVVSAEVHKQVVDDLQKIIVELAKNQQPLTTINNTNNTNNNYINVYLNDKCRNACVSYSTSLFTLYTISNA